MKSFELVDRMPAMNCEAVELIAWRNLKMLPPVMIVFAGEQHLNLLGPLRVLRHQNRKPISDQCHLLVSGNVAFGALNPIEARCKLQDLRPNL